MYAHNIHFVIIALWLSFCKFTNFGVCGCLYIYRFLYCSHCLITFTKYVVVVSDLVLSGSSKRKAIIVCCITREKLLTVDSIYLLIVFSLNISISTPLSYSFCFLLLHSCILKCISIGMLFMMTFGKHYQT